MWPLVLAGRADQMCGVIGFDRGTTASFFYNSTTTAGFTSCRQLCEERKCASFALNNEVCLLYNKTIEQNVDMDPASPNTFYDSGCTAAVSTTQIPSSTSSPGPAMVSSVMVTMKTSDSSSSSILGASTSTLLES